MVLIHTVRYVIFASVGVHKRTCSRIMIASSNSHRWRVLSVGEQEIDGAELHAMHSVFTVSPRNLNGVSLTQVYVTRSLYLSYMRDFQVHRA